MFKRKKSGRPATYAEAGVNIAAGAELVRRIAPLAADTARDGADAELGGFGGLFDLAACGFDDPVLVAATDGVGTKLKIAIDTGRHATIGIDLVAMCVNDLVVQGAQPLFFLDYFATASLDVDTAAAVVAGVAEGCKQAGCALIGGETAEMPGLYHGRDYDLAGFAVGAAERGRVYPREGIAAGDVILGLASDGLHSNGFSLVRHVLDGYVPEWRRNTDLVDELLKPTRIYVKPALAALAEFEGIKALAHITGGGLTENLPRVLPDTCGAEIDLGSWPMPSVIDFIAKTGNIATDELLRSFNCGVGMALIIDRAAVDMVSEYLQQRGESVYHIGRVTAAAHMDVAYRGDFPA